MTATNYAPEMAYEDVDVPYAVVTQAWVASAWGSSQSPDWCRSALASGLLDTCALTLFEAEDMYTIEGLLGILVNVVSQSRGAEKVIQHSALLTALELTMVQSSDGRVVNQVVTLLIGLFAQKLATDLSETSARLLGSSVQFGLHVLQASPLEIQVLVCRMIQNMVSPQTRHICASTLIVCVAICSFPMCSARLCPS